MRIGSGQRRPQIVRAEVLVQGQPIGHGPDNGLGRATGIDLVAFADGAYADGCGLVVVTDNCKHRTSQTRVGVRAGDVADWHASRH